MTRFRTPVPPSLLVNILNLLVVLAVGLILFLGLLANRRVSETGLDQQKRDACQAAAFRVYPDALTNPDSLQKLLDYSKVCSVLNNIPATPIVKLPPVPPR